MAFTDFVSTALAPSNFTTIAVLLALMAVISAVEVLIPLSGRSRWNRTHLVPNLVLTIATFVMSMFFGAAIILALIALQAAGLGLLNWYAIDPFWAIVAAVLVLDLSTYACHVALHKVPGWWRFHRVHHCDPAVDVTTSFRQHPGESVIRYVFLAASAVAIGASPVAFGIYRTLSALTALAEHASLRVPPWLDDALSLVTTWPTFHKVHHSRAHHETDSNYANIFSFWDRLFFTFTPARQGREVTYGLDGLDDPSNQTIAGLLTLPFRGKAIRSDADDRRRA
jgi:sterol desaturase/sphingolipid hydroxylase (fatty acid hydroxylase superfamily)